MDNAEALKALGAALGVVVCFVFLITALGSVAGGAGTGGTGEYAGQVASVTDSSGVTMEVSYFEAYHSESSETETFCVPDDRRQLLEDAADAAESGDRVVVRWEDPLFTPPWDCPPFSKVAVSVR